MYVGISENMQGLDKRYRYNSTGEERGGSVLLRIVQTDNRRKRVLENCQETEIIMYNNMHVRFW